MSRTAGLKINGLFPCGVALLLCALSEPALARSSQSVIHFGASRGLTFYTSPELSTINQRLGNSPRLTADKEFGRALTHSATFEFFNKTESFSWGVEAQQWAETLRGVATAGGESPRSEATLAFLRTGLTAGVRLWPWVGPTFVKRNTNIAGFAIVSGRARRMRAGFFSYLRLSTGPLLWRHDYLISDEANQTLIDYVTRSLAWDGSARWSAGWRLGGFCDLGVDLSVLRSVPVKGESAVGHYYLAGRDNSDSDTTLETNAISRSAWRATQAQVFIRFFLP